MQERELEITNEKGLHLRAASELVKLTSSLPCKISLSNGVIEVDGKSILGVAALGAARGSKILVRTTGEGEESSMEKIDDLFKRGFYENAP
ncbi:MAG: HPr family phosphocarrier protein [Candidatus Krumholzibacteria bacterium]|nr:HPr family phosphocarrier protein [Candidatus Krumholzibacteria bacterium]MDP6669756.1 HPr family phosphocarrier protein [Candidatus Krumholzibacteria bacterium]MDP6797301.1 HPr family phosphocarrier protein [Candidatus Krumholzibacteria bacterium]MDP7021212.1 HPr family phosphocarrier protein [Candidatus Krumholzibacteria bacterium]